MVNQSSDQLYCLIRKEWVAALPEEVVRQKLIDQMIHSLGYPASIIVLEKQLHQIPHVSLQHQRVKIPLRRADIICFGKGIHPQFELYPLLLIECKAVKLNQQVIRQVTGYNHFLQAHYVCIANQQEIETGWYDKSCGEYRFIPYLPSFSELMQRVLVQI